MTKTEKEFQRMCDGQSSLVFGYVDGDGNICEIDVAESEDFDTIENFIEKAEKTAKGAPCV